MSFRFDFDITCQGFYCRISAISQSFPVSLGSIGGNVIGIGGLKEGAVFIGNDPSEVCVSICVSTV
eukprot:scaffold207258_cov64-Attheya_sp.AAC.5